MMKRNAIRTFPADTPDAAAGFTMLEMVAASGLFLILLFGAVVTTHSFTRASCEGRQELDALSRNAKAIQAFGREIMNATLLDPTNDLQVFTEQETRVPDMEGGTPIPASGPVFKVRKNSKYRLDAGEVVFDRSTLEFRKDTSQDLNGDGHTDQFLRIERPPLGPCRYRVLAGNVLGVNFEKFGAVVEITCKTRGGVKGYVNVGGKNLPEYTVITQTLKVRPRNF